MSALYDIPFVFNRTDAIIRTPVFLETVTIHTGAVGDVDVGGRAAADVEVWVGAAVSSLGHDSCDCGRAGVIIARRAARRHRVLRRVTHPVSWGSVDKAQSNPALLTPPFPRLGLVPGTSKVTSEVSKVHLYIVITSNYHQLSPADTKFKSLVPKRSKSISKVKKNIASILVKKNKVK